MTKKEQKKREMTLKADKLGVPGNIKLAEYIEYMEWRIKQLEEIVRELSHDIKKRQKEN